MNHQHGRDCFRGPPSCPRFARLAKGFKLQSHKVVLGIIGIDSEPILNCLLD